MNFVGYENDDDNVDVEDVNAQSNKDAKNNAADISQQSMNHFEDNVPAISSTRTSEFYLRLCERMVESGGTYSFEQQFRCTTLFQHPNLTDEIALMGNLSSLATQLSNDVLPISWNGQHHPGKAKLGEFDAAEASEKR